MKICGRALAAVLTLYLANILVQCANALREDKAHAVRFKQKGRGHGTGFVSEMMFCYHGRY